MITLLTQKYKRIIFYLELFLMVFIFLFAYNFIPIHVKNKTFYIPSSQPTEVIHALRENGYKVTIIDEMLLHMKKIPSRGWYTVHENKFGRYAFFIDLYTMKTDRIMDVKVYAGETKKELTHRLANDLKLNEALLLQQYESLANFTEANILAQHYKIARDADENSTMQYLFYRTKQVLAPVIKKSSSKLKTQKEFKKTLIIASIIQKESNSEKEMPLISAVIHNRLDQNMYLQMDATLNYGKYAHSVIKRKRIKKDTSLYNTYKHKGLPPEPLGSITIQAFKSALCPAKEGYLYFMLTKTGHHAFSVSYKEHLKKVSLFREYQRTKKALKENNASNKNDENNISIENNKTSIKIFGFKDFTL